MSDDGPVARRIIGLTGGIGAGKSTVATLLAGLGADVIDVDAIGRTVADVGGRAHDAVVERFGFGILDEEGRLDRAVLASIVFADRSELDALEAISHPAINATLADAVADLPADAIVVLDMAILVESILGRWGAGSSEGYDTVVTVEAPMPVRRARLIERGMSAGDAERRIASQADDDARRSVAQHVVTNDGDVAALRLEVERIWPQLSAPRSTSSTSK